MTDLAASPALLRSLKRFEVRTESDTSRAFEAGERTRGVTRTFEKQALSVAAAKAATTIRKRTRTSEERRNDITRRRKWAGGGTMPDEVRAVYSEAERAAMAVIADRCKRKGFCDLCLDEIARLAGVRRTTVQNAIRKARDPERGHISFRERPQHGGKSLTNVIRIVCKTWLGWINRSIGFKRLNSSETGVKKPSFESVSALLSAFEREGAEPARSPMHVLRVASCDHGRAEARSALDLAGWSGWRR